MSDTIVRVYIDTQADVNVVGVQAIPFAEMLEKKVNLVGFNGKVSAHQQCKLTLMRDDKLITIVGLANPNPGSKTLINPTRINDDTKQVTIDHNVFSFTRIVSRERVQRFFTAFPKCGGERHSSYQRISFMFGCPLPLNEGEMVRVLTFCHLTLGCPRKNVMINTLLALGLQVPRRLIFAAISHCAMCAAFVRSKGSLVTRATNRLPNTNGEELDDVDGLVLEDEEEDERIVQVFVEPPAPVRMNRPPTREEIEELLREVDNVAEDVLQTLHVDYAHMKLSQKRNLVFLMVVMLPLGRVFMIPMTRVVRAEEKLSKIIRKWNVHQVASDRAEALNISQGVKVEHRRIPIGRKNANGYVEGYISVVRRMLKLMNFKLQQLVPGYDWDTNWELPLKMVEQIWNGRAAYNRISIAEKLDYRVMPLRLVYYDGSQMMVLYQMDDGDVMIIDRKTFEMKSVSRTQISHIPQTDNALTVGRAVKLSMKDPRVKEKYRQEIETLHKWNCFTDELPKKEDIVLSLIVIPTEVDGKIKTRIGI